MRNAPFRLIVVSLFAVPGMAAISPSLDSFDTEMQNAAAYAVQYDDPASVQKGIDQFVAVVQHFPNDPRTYSAKLRIFDILRSEGTKPSLAQAADLMGQMAKNANIASPTGEEISIRFIDFHVQDMQGQPLQDLKTATVLKDRLLQKAQTQRDRLLELRARDFSARLLIRQSQPEIAIREALDALKMTEGWGTEGFWAKMYQVAPAQYQRYTAVIERLAATAGWAVDKCSQPDIAVETVRDRHLIGNYEVLRNAVKRAMRKQEALDSRMRRWA